LTSLAGRVLRTGFHLSNRIGYQDEIPGEHEIAPDGVDVDEDDSQDKGEDDGGSIPGQAADHEA